MRINFELLDLRMFLAVIDCKGFHAAAQSLNISQSSLSRRIQALEETVDAALFKRSTRSVVLTPVGREIEPIFRKMVGEVDSSIESLTGAGESRAALVALACIPTVINNLLPNVLKQYRMRRPNVRFRLFDLSAREALDSVLNGEAELGINMMGQEEPDLMFTKLFDDPFVLLCPHDHPLAFKKRVNWKDLHNEQFIAPNHRSGIRPFFEKAVSAAAVSLDTRYEFNHPTTAFSLVGAGLGLAILPQLALSLNLVPHLVVRAVHEPKAFRTIGLVERKGVNLSAAAKSFRALLIENSINGFGKTNAWQTGAKMV